MDTDSSRPNLANMNVTTVHMQNAAAFTRSHTHIATHKTYTKCTHNLKFFKLFTAPSWPAMRKLKL